LNIYLQERNERVRIKAIQYTCKTRTWTYCAVTEYTKCLWIGYDNTA